MDGRLPNQITSRRDLSDQTISFYGVTQFPATYKQVVPIRSGDEFSGGFDAVSADNLAPQHIAIAPGTEQEHIRLSHYPRSSQNDLAIARGHLNDGLGFVCRWDRLVEWIETIVPVPDLTPLWTQFGQGNVGPTGIRHICLTEDKEIAVTGKGQILSLFDKMGEPRLGTLVVKQPSAITLPKYCLRPQKAQENQEREVRSATHHRE